MSEITGLIVGNHDDATIEQFKDVAERAKRAALMADGHLGYIMPVGGVAAYENKVSIAGVGYDIACGNAAIRTNLTLEMLTKFTIKDVESDPSIVSNSPSLNRLADEIFNTISFGIGRTNRADDAPVDDPLFHDDAWWIIPNAGGYRDSLIAKARKQLGTVGSGNHYVDVFVDEMDYIWVGVHFGSRGLGHTIASDFLALSAGKAWGERVKEHEGLVDLDSQVGQDYWSLMTLAGKYAYVGREWVARKVVELLGGQEMDLVHNHHNFAWKENHFGEDLIVVRKGATPAFPGQRGFVGGSMGDNAVILQGTQTVDLEHYPLFSKTDLAYIENRQKHLLYSTVHGAGRVMSRKKAAGKWKKGRQIKAGEISPKMMKDWLNTMGVILRGGGLDEAPQAYRRLDNVLKEQGPTIEVLHTLRPLIVCMAGADVFDPYKD